MKRRNAKRKPKAKRKSEQKPNGQPKQKSKAPSSKDVATQEVSKYPVNAVTTPGKMEELASVAGIGTAIEDPPSPAEIREAVEDSTNFAEAERDAEDLANTLEVQVEIEESDSAAKVDETSDNPTAVLGIYDGAEITTIPVATPVIRVGRAPQSVVDRRAHPRYDFAAAVEVIAPEAGVHLKAQVRDLSQQGCYVDMNDPLALGTAVELKITRGPVVFEARARVVFNQARKGMGLIFTHVEAEQLKTLNNWIAESRQSSWRATNRRRSQRALMRIPVRVSGESANGAGFVEKTHTLSISAHGALVVVSVPVNRGQRIILLNLQTGAALECVVVNVDRTAGGSTEAGVEFTLPHPNFWRVAFPPKDWTPRHPDAKSS